MNKRFYLNEEEKSRILKMHKPKLNENVLVEQSLQDIQNIILDNGGYVGKLGADNKLGPDTLNAIYNSLTKGFAKNNTATTTASTATTTPSTATTTPSTATTTPTTGTTETMPIKSLSGMTVQNNVANQQLATGPVRSGQEIRQDFRQQNQQNRQMARQDRKDTRQMERELSDLEGKYKRLQGKMRPQDKMSYETQIAKLKKDLGK